MKDSFKFSEILVRKYSLMALISHSSGSVTVTAITMDLSQNPMPIDKAIIEMREKYQELPFNDKSRIIIPIFCLDRPSPIIGSVAGLLVPNLPDSLSNQISALQLENPIELRTRISGTPSIGSTFVDITSDRIVIIGNTQETIEYLRLLCSRFYFKQLSPSFLAQQLQRLLANYPKTMIGSSMLIGGFGAIFSFGSAFLLSRAFSGQSADFGYVFASVLAMLAVITFLFEEAFGNKMVVFAHYWALKVKLAAWVVFISLIMLAPVGAFSSFFPIEVALDLMWFHAILISVICALSYLGQFAKPDLPSKRDAIFYRLLTAFLIWFLPFMEDIIF